MKVWEKQIIDYNAFNIIHSVDVFNENKFFIEGEINKNDLWLIKEWCKLNGYELFIQWFGGSGYSFTFMRITRKGE